MGTSHLAMLVKSSLQRSLALGEKQQQALVRRPLRLAGVTLRMWELPGVTARDYHGLLTTSFSCLWYSSTHPPSHPRPPPSILVCHQSL